MSWGRVEKTVAGFPIRGGAFDTHQVELNETTILMGRNGRNGQFQFSDVETVLARSSRAHGAARKAAPAAAGS